MTLRLLMIDVDGVIVRPREDRRWFHSIENDLGVKPHLLAQHYFNDLERDALIGKADVHEQLGIALARFAPHVSATQVSDYLVAFDGRLDEVLMRGLAGVRASGIQIHLATNQTHLRADHLWRSLDLQSHFDAMHHSAELGFTKPDPGFYSEATRRCGRPSHEIGFIDDREENVLAAHAAGWRGYRWKAGSGLGDALAALDP